MKHRKKLASFIMFALAGLLSSCGILAPRPINSDSSDTNKPSESSTTQEKITPTINIYVDGVRVTNNGWTNGIESLSGYNINQPPVFSVSVAPSDASFTTRWVELETGISYVDLPIKLGVFDFTVYVRETNKYNATQAYSRFKIVSLGEQEQEYNVYSGESRFNVMHDWGHNSDGVIGSVVYDDHYQFLLQKGQKPDWAFVSALIEDNDRLLYPNGLKTIHFEVVGNPGITALFKFESMNNYGSSVETGQITFTGESQTIDLDVSTTISARDTRYRAIIFPLPGQFEVPYDVDIYLNACYMDDARVIPLENTINVATYKDVFLDIPSYHDDCYTLHNDNHVTTINYDASSSYEWANIQYKFVFDEAISSWVDQQAYTLIHGEFVSDVNVRILLKPYDNGMAERNFDLIAGQPQTIEFEVDQNCVDPTKPFVVFVNPGRYDNSLSRAQIGMTGLRICRNTANVDEGGLVRINKVNNANSGLTNRINDRGDLEVNFNVSEAGYGNMMELFVSHINMSEARYISGTILSNVNTKVLLKPGDINSNERMITLQAGVPLKVDFRFNEEIDNMWGKFIIFVAVPDSESLQGTIKFQSFYLSDHEFDNPIVYAEAQPIFGNYHGQVTLGDGSTSHIIVYLTNMREVVFQIQNKTKYINCSVGSLYEYNEDTHMLTIHIDINGSSVTAYYDSATHQLTNVTILYEEWVPYVSNNGNITLNGAKMLWDCDGTTEELQATFKRRYRSSSSWQVDAGNSDRYTSNSDRFIKGKSMKRRGWTNGAVGTSLNEDLDGATDFKAFAFWVYNPSEKDIGLRVWLYKSVGLQNSAELTNSTNNDSRAVAVSGQWTFVYLSIDSLNFPEGTGIYNFQIADFTNSGVYLSFDNICFF